jgi:putative hydrolase of HD superfamily
MQKKIINIIKFLNEIELLKSITRHSWMSSGRQESVAEHSWRMAIMAMALENEFPDIDIKRVMEITLVHDF